MARCCCNNCESSCLIEKNEGKLCMYLQGGAAGAVDTGQVGLDVVGGGL